MFRNINSKEELIDELSGDLDVIGLGMELFIDLTAQNIGFSFIDPFDVDLDVERQLDGHKIVYIDAVSSREGFEIMRDFSDRCGERQRTRLMHALSKRHPFRVFKNVVSDLGLLDEWYAFKNSAYREIAQSRLEDCEIDFIDGKIICGNNDNISTYRCEDFDDNFDDDE